MTDHRNRETVESSLERLRSEYGPFPVFEETEVLEPDRFASFREEVADGYSGAGYARVVRDPEDAPPLSASMPDYNETERPQVLYILHRGDDDRAWTVPGGGREGDETYEAAAVREIREETAVDVDVGEPLAAHRVRCLSTDDGVDLCLHGLWVCFAGTYAGGSVSIQQGELRGAAWFADPPGSAKGWGEYCAADWWDDHEAADPWWERLDRRDPE